jgi:hypothetical protein
VYLVLGANSVSKNLTSATSAFPSYTKQSTGYYISSTTCQYNIMGICDDDGTITYGIPKNYCNGFTYSGIVMRELGRVLYGEIFPNVIFN